MNTFRRLCPSLFVNAILGVVALATAQAQEAAGEITYEAWVKHFTPGERQDRVFKDKKGPRWLVITAVEGDAALRLKDVSALYPPSYGAYSYGRELSRDGRGTLFSHGSRGSKGSGYTQLTLEEMRRVDEMLATLPDDGGRLPPSGRRLLVQVFGEGEQRSRVYDRANPPNHVLELMRLAGAGIRTEIVEIKPTATPAMAEGSISGVFTLMPDHKQLLTAGWNGPFKIWNLATRELVREVPRPSYIAASGLVLSPDGMKAIISGGYELVVSDVATWKRLKVLAEPEVGRRIPVLSDPLFSADGRHLLARCTASVSPHVGAPLRIFDTGTWERKDTLPGVPADAFALAPAPDWRRAIVETKDYELVLWDVAAMRALAKLDSGARLDRAAFSPDGRSVAIATLHRRLKVAPDDDPNRYWSISRLRLWDTETGALQLELRPFEFEECEAIEGVCWTPDGAYVLAAAKGSALFGAHGIAVWNARTGRHRGTFSGAPSRPYEVLLHEGELFAVGSDEKVSVWDFPAGMQRIREFDRQFEGTR